MLPFAAPPTTRPSDATAHELELLKLRGLRQQTENLLRAAPYTAAAAEPHAALGTHAGLLARFPEMLDELIETPSSSNLYFNVTYLKYSGSRTIGRNGPESKLETT